VSFLGLEFASPALIEAVHDEDTQRTLGGRFRGLRTGTSWWRIEMRLELRGFDTAVRELAIHRNRHGQTVPFAFPMPQMTQAESLPTPVTTAIRKAGATSVSIQDANNPMAIPSGWFVTFAGHTKVYQIAEPVNARGPLSVDIFPALVVDVAANVALDMSPNLTCVYERRSGGAWQVNRVNVVDPRLRVVET